MITVYSTGCPQCVVLKKKLADKKIDFTLIENNDEIIKVASKYGLIYAPFMIVNDKAYNFLQSIEYINNL